VAEELAFQERFLQRGTGDRHHRPIAPGAVEAGARSVMRKESPEVLHTAWRHITCIKSQFKNRRRLGLVISSRIFDLIRHRDVAVPHTSCAEETHGADGSRFECSP
jgi:hypothetical protein